jgi:LPXTG-motif cell wall-anchored protein
VVPDAQYTELAIRGRVGQQAEGLSVLGWFGAVRPGTAATMTVQSTPVVIGRATAGFDGGADVRGVLPALPAGTHRVVIAGTTLDGLPVTAELAFGVGADGRITWIGRPGSAAGLAATGSDADTTVPLAVLLLVSGVGLLGLRRRLVVVRSS